MRYNIYRGVKRAKTKTRLFLSTGVLGLASVVMAGVVALPAFAAGGFDQYGYNDKARVFSGTGASWCETRGALPTCLGIYSPDQLVMKWNAEWDRGNTEGWSNPPYNAWTNNEWNGKSGGSGAVWEYKIVWVEPCGSDYIPLDNGGYCIWGQFEVIMDQGTDPNLGPGHMFNYLASPAGYGSYYSH